MTPRVPSKAYRQVIAAAATRGATVTARQLERWRQLDAIPETDREWPGRGHGSRSTYTDDEIDYILGFAGRFRRGIPASYVVLWLFRDDFAVPDSCLRFAYRDLFIRLRSAMIKIGAGGGDAMDQAERITEIVQRRPGPESRQNRKHLRSVHRQLEESGYFATTGDGSVPTFRSFEQSYLTNMILTATDGESASHEGAAELAAIELLRIRGGGLEMFDDQFVSDHEANSTNFTVGHAEHASQHAPLPMIRRAFQIVETDVKLFGNLRNPDGSPDVKLFTIAASICVSLRHHNRVNNEGVQLSYQELWALMLASEADQQASTD